MPRRKLIGMIATLLVAVLLVSSGSVLPTPHQEGGQDRLVVMTYNTGGTSGKKPKGSRIRAVEAVIRRAAPDLLLLQECRAKHCDSLASAMDMPFSEFLPYQGKKKSGLAILSKHPLAEPRAHYFPESPHGLGFLVCNVSFHGRTLQVANIHLDRIQCIQRKKAMPQISWGTALCVVLDELLEETLRTRQVELLLQRMHAGPLRDTILAGDFNTIPYAAAIRKVQARYQDALWPSSDFFSNTYKDLGFPLKPRIDYIFHSADLCAEDGGILRTGPGDHYPVWAAFTLRHRRG